MSLLDDIKAKVTELEARAELAEHAILSEIMFVLGKDNHSTNPDSEAPIAVESVADAPEQASDATAPETAPVEIPAPVVAEVIPAAPIAEAVSVPVEQPAQAASAQDSAAPAA